MADEHSEPGGMKVLRLYADASGESRFETTTMPLALKEFAPPAAPLRVSDPQPAQNCLREDETRWRVGLPGACEHW
jgi:hypothetical protein